MPEPLDLGRMIAYCGHLGKLCHDKHLRQSGYDITPVQSHALGYLARCGEVNQRKLEQELHLKPSTVNGIVNRLEEKGYITRRASLMDGRCRLVSLTDSGWSKIVEFRAALVETDRIFTSALSAEEQEHLRSMLARIIANLESEVKRNMIKKLWPYTRGYRKWIALGVICSASEAVFELLLPLVMADIVDTGIPAGDISYILQRGLLMVVMALVSMSLGVSAAFLSSRAGQGFGANLRQAQYDHIQEFSFRNIEKFSTASLVTRLTNDCNMLQMSLMMGMRLLVRAPVMLVSALVLAVSISLKLSGVFLVAMPLLLVMIIFVITRVSPLFTGLQERTDGLNLVVQENLSAIRVVKSFVREDYEEEKFRKRSSALRETAEKAFGFVVINMPLMMLITYGTIIAVMWYGAPLVQAGELDVALLSTFFTYITQVLMSLMMVSMIMMMLTRAIACAKRVIEVLDEQPDITDRDADGSLQVSDGSIDFDHVSFKYNAGSGKWNLHDIDLHIPSGATVGIIGGTGSAKSTLVQLIPRLYEAQEGVVRVGGRPVKEYTTEHLRDAVSMVLQKNTLFSGTIRENLLWGREDATDEEIEAACEAACAAEFIHRMPEGYGTDLGQGGVNVSGGQKQRLCIARAILKKPKVLILDDSTSAVDTATDAKIRQAFRTQLPDTTKIIIAQRVISVMDADLIVVMDDGRIAELGTHEELMKNSEIYRDVYQSQQEGALE